MKKKEKELTTHDVEINKQWKKKINGNFWRLYKLKIHASFAHRILSLTESLSFAKPAIWLN